MRRHGAPDQRGITKADLKPYLAIVRARIGKNEGLTIWSKCDQRWLALVGHVEGYLSGIDIAWRRQAAREVIKLATAVEPRKVMETALAVYLMRDQAGHRFKGDKAFDTQLVRRLRGLTELNSKVSVSVGGRRSRVYSELPPKATAIIAAWINTTLGVAGLWLAKGERDAEDRKRRERDSFNQGLAEVDFGQ